MKKMGIKHNYDKIWLFLFSILLAYWIFYEKDLEPVNNLISSFGYFGTFVSGALYTYGFTSAPATALLLILAKEQNIIFAGLIGGLGSLLSDLLILKYVRFSFAEELMLLSQKGKDYLKFLPKYSLTLLAAVIIASPLPDEIGISLLAFDKNVSIKNFSIISFILNTIGILIVLYIGKSI